MKYLSEYPQRIPKKTLGIFFAVILSLIYGAAVFATAPSGGYAPGQTLDPACAPGDTDCQVAIDTLTFDSPLVKSGTTVSLPAASAGIDGYLSASDWNRFDDKQDSFGSGTSLQYLRGDNTWQDLTTDAVAEGSNEYWTNSRFDTRLANATSAGNLSTVGTITSGTWQGSQITDAYVSNSITASNYIPLTQRGSANGVATLDGSGKVPSSQLSSFSLSDTFVVNDETEMLALSGAELGDVAIRLDENKSYILTTNDPSNVSNWQQIITPLDFVLSVNGQVGAVDLTSSDIAEGTNLYYTDARVDDYLNTVKGVANGIATLDSNGKIPTAQLGSLILNETHVVADTTEMLALTGVQNGDLAVVTDTSQTFVLADENNPSDIDNWVEILNGSPVTSVNGQVGSVSLTTTNISEGSNQYFTNARARGALSATGPLSYSSSTGVFGITQANASTNGYLSAVDWNTFDDKQDALTFGNLTASSNPEITITGGTGAIIGTGLDIAIPDASNSARGLITTSDQAFAGIKTFADGIGVGDDAPTELFSVGVGGLFQVDETGDLVRIKNIAYSWPSSQGSANTVLVNNGSGALSWSSNGVVTLNGLTGATQTFATSTSGSDFSISSSGTAHTFNFPTASASARGALSSTKYTEFNDKPYVDTTYNNIYASSLSGGAALNGSGGGINNIIMGYQAGDTLSTGNNNTFLGYQSGKSATTGVAHAVFAGYQSGLSATSATHSIFIGRSAGSGATSASFAIFGGRSSGQSATGAQYGVFIGDNSGNAASGSSNAIFLGQNAGYQATTAPFTVAIGTSAGYQATGTTTANFIGYGAGYQASDADYANFFGRLAGNTATSAAYSNFMGYQAGSAAANAANSIFIGKNAGLNDTVNNTVSGSSIAIGDSAGTGGFQNSIALGASAVNTAANQLLIGSSYTALNVRGVDYTWPSAQAAGSGYVLSNDGSGGLSWVVGSAPGGSSTELQYNNGGAFGGISGVTYDGTNLDANDAVFRLADNADPTKRAIFQVSGIDAGTTRTFTFPNNAGTFALATGLSGGQTIYGGTANGNDLTLGSTSNATKGKILFGTSAYDEVNNRLGIGTTTPTSALHVQTSGVGMSIGRMSDVPWGSFGFDLTALNSGTYVMYGGPGLDVAINSPVAAKSLFFNTQGSTRVAINSSGRTYFGGSTSATALVHLAAGTATASTAPLKFTSGTNLTTPEAGTMEYDGTSLFFTPASTRYNVLMNNYGLSGGQTIVGGTAASNTLTLYSTSHATKGKILLGTGAFASAYDEVNLRLGIGTQSPTAKLSIFDGANNVTFLNFGANSAAGLFTLGYNAGTMTMTSSEYGPFNIITNGGNQNINLVPNGSGKVGIGTTAPPVKLSVVSGSISTIQGGGASDSTIQLRHATENIGHATALEFSFGNGNNSYLGSRIVGETASAGGGNLHFQTGSSSLGTYTTKMIILKNGNVGVGALSPSYRLDVSDTTTAGIVGSFTNSDGTCTLDPGDVSGWSCPSDLNLKKDITTLETGSLGNILALRPVNYRLINEDNSVNLSTGLIAQEVQTIFPNLVKTQIDGTLALNYGGLTPYMISAIQEMNLQITEINNTEKPNSWRDTLIAWFGNMTNGITKIYAQVFESEQVKTQQLCVGETCLNEIQVQQLLQVIGSQSVPPSNPTPDPGNSGDDTGTGDGSGDVPPDDTPTDSGDGSGDPGDSGDPDLGSPTNPGIGGDGSGDPDTTDDSNGTDPGDTGSGDPAGDSGSAGDTGTSI